MMPFSTQRLIDLVRAEATEVRHNRRERIRLAAVLFASCQRLTLEERSAETGFDPLRERWGLETALVRLSELDDALSSGELFGYLLSGLLAIDQSYRPDGEHPLPYHPSVVAECTHLEVPGDPDPLLSGLVYHWINVPSAIRQARKVSRRKKGPREFLDPVTQNLEYLTLYMPQHDKPVLRSLRHHLSPLRAQIDRGGSLLQQGDFKVAFCPLIGDWHPLFEIINDVGPPSFRALESNAVAHPAELDEHLVDLVRLAAKEEIRILVFPELSLDEGRRALLERELKATRNKLIAVFAGTFHTQDRPMPYNESIVLDASGFRYWNQRKNSRYSVPAGVDLGAFFPGQEGPLDQAIHEYIRYGNDLWFFDSTLGRMVIIICTDAIDRYPLSYVPLIHVLGPELVIVLSMSDVTRDFWGFAAEMVRHGMSVAFINAACVCEGSVDRDLFLLELAIREVPGAPPVRWRWLADVGSPQWYDRRRKVWTPLALSDESSGGKGVWRLQDRGTCYGIVVDFAAMLSRVLI